MKAAMIQVGELVQNRFRVKEQIGQGGFAQVFLVDDGGTLKILKILNLDNFPNVTNQQKAIALFQQEAAVLQKLNHSGIPKVEHPGYFIWENETGQQLHCFVMEFIAGQDLQRWLEEDTQPLREIVAIDWLRQLVAIVEQLHQQNYFHRDIKPSNIILKPNGEVVLIDFGSVRETSNTYLATLAEDREVTRLFTQGYAPLEQINGKSVPQSDFYALGRTFVHLLTRTHPTQIPDSDVTGDLTWRDQAEVSQQLAELLDWLMGFLPRERPQTIEDIWQKLAALQSDSVNAPISNKYLLGSSDRPQQRNILLYLKPSILKIGSILGLVALISVSIWRWAAPQLALELSDAGEKLYQNGKIDQAKSYFIWATRLDSNLSVAYYNWGSACEEQKDFTCAREKYQIALRGGFLRAFNNMGRLYIISGQGCEAAKPLLSEGLRLVKDDDKLKAALLRNLNRCHTQQANKIFAAKP